MKAIKPDRSFRKHRLCHVFGGPLRRWWVWELQRRAPQIRIASDHLQVVWERFDIVTEEVIVSTYIQVSRVIPRSVKSIMVEE